MACTILHATSDWASNNIDFLCHHIPPIVVFEIIQSQSSANYLSLTLIIRGNIECVSNSDSFCCYFIDIDSNLESILSIQYFRHKSSKYHFTIPHFFTCTYSSTVYRFNPMQRVLVIIGIIFISICLASADDTIPYPFTRRLEFNDSQLLTGPVCYLCVFHSHVKISM